MWWNFDESQEGVRQQTLFELWPKIRSLFAQQRAYLLVAFLLLPVITACQLTGPLILQHIIDKVVGSGDTQALLLSALFYIGMQGAAAGLGYIQGMNLFRLGIRIITELKGRLFRQVLHLGLDFHEQYSPGKLISRVESDTNTLAELFSDVTVNLLRNTLLFLGILAVLCVKNFGIAVWIMLMVPLMFVATSFYIRNMRRYWRELRARIAVVTGYVAEYVQGVEVIQQFNYEARAKERMREVNLHKYKIDVPTQFLEYGYWGAFMYGEVVAIIIVLALGVKGVLAGTMSLGLLVLFIENIRQLFQPIMQLSEQINFMQRGLISVERVFSILEAKRTIVDGPRPAGGLRFDQEIRFEGVWFRYEEFQNTIGPDTTAQPGDAAEADAKWILRDVSFTISKGERVALVGASGGGKSTLINLLLRFYDPQRGRITVDGTDIREYPVEAWRALMGLVLQDIFLFAGSVGDNLRVFDDRVTTAQLDSASSVARADSVIAKLPQGYDSELNERGANLSVGERQLLSFARALARDPEVLVLDEATSSVDPLTEQLVQQSLEALLAGRTSVIVAHRLSTILKSDKIMLIHRGKLAESGRHEELLARGGLYAKLCALQFGPASTPLPAGMKYSEGDTAEASEAVATLQQGEAQS